MLRVRFGEMDNVYYGPYWFINNYRTDWLKDDYVQKMIEDVDKSRYVDGYVIDSPVFGPIPPERLSGGLQTLIVIYERPDLIFDATSCGQNCSKWLVDIGKKKNVTVNLNYLMHLEEVPGFEVYIENESRAVSSPADYVYSAVKYV